MTKPKVVLPIEGAPPEFTVVENGSVCSIQRTPPSKAVNWLVAAFLSALTILTAFAVCEDFYDIQKDGPTSALPLVGVWCFFMLMMPLVVSGRHFMLLSENSLTTEVRTYLFTDRRVIPRDTITHVAQIEYESEGADWWLEVAAKTKHGERSYWLFHHERPSTCRWLGRVIAKWANVELEVVPEEDDRI